MRLQSSPHTLMGKLRQFFSPVDPVMVFVLGLICLISIVVMYSATTDRPDRFAKHLFNLMLGWSVMVVVAYVPSKYYTRFAIPAFALGVVLLIAVALFGSVTLGARRWLNLGIARIQPSELLKIAMPLMMAYYFQMTGVMNEKRQWKKFGIAALLLLVPFFLIARQPDLGTALLVAAAGAFVIFYAGISWRILIGLFFLGVVSLPLVYFFALHDYQRRRIDTLINPGKDARGAGFHILQAKTAIGSGGLFGTGWMNGSQSQLQFIPEKSTDFLLAVYSEEFGLVGVILLIVLYLLLVLRGLSIASDANSRFEKLLAGSLSMIIFTYVFVNMGMVAGILPVVGVPLPFMSYGGTALVTLGVACGMLMSIRHARIS